MLVVTGFLPAACAGAALRKSWPLTGRLLLEAKVDIKLVSESLGHSTTTITRDLYQHVRIQLQVDAAEQTVKLLPEHRARDTGS